MADRNDKSPERGRRKPEAAAAREQRLAEALRANLKRRKQKNRAERPSPDDTSSSGGSR